MSSPQTVHRLGQISLDYQERASAYASIADDAATAESEYRRLKAVAVVTAKHEGNAVSMSEYIADADPVVADACRRYKVTTAAADAARAKLTQLRAQLDYGRTVAASERELDRLHASSIGGAA